MAEVEKYNVEAREAYDACMPTCGKCSRTFETNEKLMAHASSCTACPKDEFVRTGEPGESMPEP